MAQVRPLRPHTFRIDNCVIDDYAAEMGAMGVALYAVLQRYADRETGQCWPSVATMAATLHLSQTAVKKYLRHLAQLGLISIASRYTAAGDHSSNLYTVHDPIQPEALLRRRRQRQGGACGDGGGSCSAPPPLPVGHLATHGGSPGARREGRVGRYTTHPRHHTTHPDVGVDGAAGPPVGSDRGLCRGWRSDPLQPYSATRC